MHRYIISVISLFLLIGCDTRNQYHNLMYTENKFKVQMHEVNTNTFIVWPETIRTIPIQENKKFIKILKRLGSFHDVSIVITPIYDTKTVSPNVIADRCFVIRDLLLEFGVNANRIEIAKTKKPLKIERGINVRVIYYSMEVPNCDSIKQKQTQPLEYPLPNFGCATAANFGKMVAYPSSVVQYKRTESDDRYAIDAIVRYQEKLSVPNAGNSSGGGYDDDDSSGW